jgi:hypothetical protein
LAVYVDNYRASFGRMVMSHMIADTREELLEMVDKIGVQRKWIQSEGKYSEHFDICLSKRARAVELGAVELSSKELVLKMREKRK